MYEAFWGRAFRFARDYANRSQEDVAMALSKRAKRDISPALLDGMEKDIEEIDSEMFDTWCEVLQCDQALILKCAQRLAYLSHRSQADIFFEDIHRELDFNSWKLDQENQ